MKRHSIFPRRVRTLLLLLLCAAALLACLPSAAAAGGSDDAAAPLPEIPLTPEIMQCRIYSFDVSPEGNVLLLLEDEYLLLCRSADVPEKCFRIDADGSCWAYWQGNRIAILRARENTVRTYDPDGTCCEDITPTDPVAYNHLMNALQHKTEVSVGEDVYAAEKENWLYGLFCGYSYDQLSVHHADGSAEILYHTDIWKRRMGGAALLYLGLIPAMVLLAIWYHRRSRRREQGREADPDRQRREDDPPRREPAP